MADRVPFAAECVRAQASIAWAAFRLADDPHQGHLFHAPQSLMWRVLPGLADYVAQLIVEPADLSIDVPHPATVLLNKLSQQELAVRVMMLEMMGWAVSTTLPGFSKTLSKFSASDSVRCSPSWRSTIARLMIPVTA